VHRSTVDIKFRTPPPPPDRSAFNGGGGPECWLNIALRSTVQWQAHRWMVDGAFRTPPPPPPPIDLFLMVWGGVQNGVIFWRDFFSTWQESIGPKSHRLPFSDIPPSPHDIIFHLFPLRVTSHNSVSPFPLFAHYKSFTMVTPNQHPPRHRSYFSFIVTCHLTLQRTHWQFITS
jgi:hypothetical protein